MRIVCVDTFDNGRGGALRGMEMLRALQSLGHEARWRPPEAPALAKLTTAPDCDAVIFTGTWHVLAFDGGVLHRLAAACAAQRIPCLWWFGSNGSVFGCVHPDPRTRLAEEQRVIAEICDRPFIGVICPYSADIYARHGVPRDKMRLVPSVFDGELFTPNLAQWEARARERLAGGYSGLTFSECWDLIENVRATMTRAALGIPENAFVLGTTGHCPNSKGGDDVIRAIALLRDEMPDLYYVILHCPEDRLNRVKATSPDGKRIGKSECDVLEDSKRLAIECGVADRCRFVGGQLIREAMPIYYRLLNVYCSPSKAENLGQPLVESQLCGLPLVTYAGFSFDFVACPATSAQIPPHHVETDDYGLVIPFADPAVLADAIRRARKTAEAGGNWVTRNWTYSKFHHLNAQKMVDAIEEYRCLL